MKSDRPTNTYAEIQKWLGEFNDFYPQEVATIPLAELVEWRRTPSPQYYEHRTKSFFSICGLQACLPATGSNVEQPIIHQPEIGILGLLVRRDGSHNLEALVQAKAEPGNVGETQLSPTLQATRSNFMCYHGGKEPYFLSYFLNPEQRKIHCNSLQSEQGFRFYKKRNRNIVVELSPDEEPELPSGFKWLSLKD